MTPRTPSRSSLAAIGLGLAIIAVAAPLGARLTGWSAFIVTGGSMEPTIRLGSLIIARAVDPAELRVDDVVVVRNASGLVTHRVTAVAERVGGRAFTLKGDANPVPDVAPVVFVDRAGSVVAAVPHAGIVAAYARAALRPAIAVTGLALLFLAFVTSVRRRPVSGRAERLAQLRGTIALAPTDLAAHRQLAAMLFNDGDVRGAVAEYVRFETILRAIGDDERIRSEREYRRTVLRWAREGRVTLGPLRLTPAH